MLPVFVDFATIRQAHPEGGLPCLNGGKHIRIDSDGTIEYVLDRRAGLDGSYDSRVEVRCDGFNVEFSGNIARYNRRDNLFGYDWPETVARINSLLNLFSLPPFTVGKLFRFADRGWTWTGARVSRIDVTVNYGSGSAHALAALLRALSGHHVGRQKGQLRPDGMTVEYGRGSRYVYGKFYSKAAEFIAHQGRKSGAHVAQDVIDYATELGIGREEFTLKGNFLLQNGLSYLGAITHSGLVDIYCHRSQLRRLQQVCYDDFSELPRRLRATYAAWRDGEPIKVSRATFYKHRRDLLKYGVDISIPSNVRTMPIRIHKVDVAALEAPSWYRQKYG